MVTSTIRLLIVDDSAVMRRFMRETFAAEPDFATETACDGRDALARAAVFRPHVITLDVTMPEMDGLDCLRALPAHHACPVVMVSSLTAEAARITLEALSLGAVDFFAKPTASLAADLGRMRTRLVATVRTAAAVRQPAAMPFRLRAAPPPRPPPVPTARPASVTPAPLPEKPAATLGPANGPLLSAPSPRLPDAPSPLLHGAPLALFPVAPPALFPVAPLALFPDAPPALFPGAPPALFPGAPPARPPRATTAAPLPRPWLRPTNAASLVPSRIAPGLVLIGVSTGGPRALELILPLLSARFPWPVLVAQHMPPTFTGALAQRLSSRSALQVVEVTGPMPIRPGVIHIGAGDTDLVVARDGADIIARPAPPDASPWHPSANRLVASALEFLPANKLIGVLLTGMGDDGAAAMAELHMQGGRTIAESDASAVVFGMPADLIRRNGATKILPVEQVAAVLGEWVGAPR